VNTFSKTVLGLAAAAAVVVAGPAVAYADPAPAPSPTLESKPTPSAGPVKDVTVADMTGQEMKAAGPDGNLYVWSDDMQRSLLYSGNASEGWPDGWNNRVDVLWNNGFPGSYDDVNIYDYATWSGSAYACIGNGDWWDLRRTNYVFSWVNDGADAWQRSPLGRPVHDHGSGHVWVDWCGNNNR
jgi:hypothetical protein